MTRSGGAGCSVGRERPGAGGGPRPSRHGGPGADVMQALAAHSRRRRRLWPLILATVVILGAAGAGLTFALRTHGAAGGTGDGSKSGANGGHTASAGGSGGGTGKGFTVVATTPQTGSAG